jgi:hypothetical protein
MSKQIVYSGFNARMMSNMIDCFLVGTIVSPISLLCENFFGEIISRKRIAEVLQENSHYLKQQESINFIKAMLTNPLISNEFFMQGGLTRLIIYSTIQLVMALAILTYCWFYFQSSPGKILIGLKIADAETFDKITLKQSFKRAVMCALTLFPFGIFAVFFNKKRQTWHDKLANTVVIKR